MSSRKLQMLDVINRYFAHWGYSPTIGELGAALRVNRKRAHALVHQLKADGLIDVLPGQTRGIRLIDLSDQVSEGQALALLRAMGWVVNGEAVERPIAQAFAEGATEKGLFGLPILDFNPA
jgi:SOS-response transcriptional repressor LexA